MRKSFSGAAVATTLNGNLSSTANAAPVNGISNFPNTSVGPFVVCIDRGESTEEKALVATYAGNTLNFAQRGYDGTTPQNHQNGGSVECTIDATTIDTHDAFVAGNGSVAPTASAPGDASSNGSSIVSAAADHKHAREAFGVGLTTASAPNDTAADGVSPTLARADHKHGREAPGLPAGLSGATIATRYVGGTGGGAPVSGTFAKGDFVIDSTDGTVWICTVAGSPGTWQVPYPVGIPAGTAYVTGSSTANGSFPAFVGASENLKGGMLLNTTTSTGTGLQVPVAGLYHVDVQFEILGALSSLQAGIGKNNAVVKWGSGAGFVSNGTSTAAVASGLVNCAANDVLNLWYQIGGSAAYVVNGSLFNYISAHLVSQ